MSQKTKITVSGILQDLENGLTRTTTGKNYNADIGCIQEKYNLSNYDLEMLFRHPKLKGKKTKSVRTVSFVLEDDTENLTNILIEDDTENRNVETVSNNVMNVEEPSLTVTVTETPIGEIGTVTENTTNLEEHVVEETTNEEENTLFGGGWD